MLLFGLFRVSGESMLPTFQSGNLLLGRQWLIRPKVGNIIVVLVENRSLIKRISAINGDQIEVLGDNVSFSTDSRSFGPISRSCIQAKIIWRLSHTTKA